MKQLWLIFLFVTFIVFLTGCNEKVNPADRMNEFVKAWEEQNFDNMYERLSTISKETLSKQEFIERHQTIYEKIEMENLSIDFTPPSEEEMKTEDGKVSFTYQLSMDTVAGEIKGSNDVTLTQEETDNGKDWYITWNDTFILPDLQAGQEVEVEYFSPVRGEIIDRNGLELAENGTVYEIGLVPEQIEQDKEAIINETSTLLDVSVEFIKSKLNASWVQPSYFVPIKSVSMADNELVKKLTSIEGVLYKEKPARVYPFKEVGAHLVGYIGALSQDELETLAEDGYTQNSLIGKRGLEKVFEEKLRGKRGAKVYIKGEEEEITIAEQPAVDGETVQLTIDMALQQNLYEELKNDVGAAVAVHPITGETLALVSAPSYDPNKFILGMSDEEWDQLQNNPVSPLHFRAGMPYAPGSTFKPVTAAIALDNEIITTDQVRAISGKRWQKDASWGGYQVTRVSEVGQVDLRKAFIYSDNIYFAMTALEIGAETFHSSLKQFGFEEDFPYEYPFYNSVISKDELTDEILLADSGYGQGQLEMTPLHLAMTYTPLLNEGNLVKPRLLLGSEREVWHENVMTPETASIIKELLVEVIEDKNGTGRDARIPGITLAGKTGTAELKTSQSEKGKENGLFVAFNTEDPSLLITILIEDAKHGSHDAVPKAKKVFEQQFKD